MAAARGQALWGGEPGGKFATAPQPRGGVGALRGCAPRDRDAAVTLMLTVARPARPAEMTAAATAVRVVATAAQK